MSRRPSGLILPPGLAVLADTDRAEDQAPRESLRAYFDEANLQRPMTRNEYLNLRASEEFSRREGRGWRGLWNRIAGRLIIDIPDQMASAHARSLAAKLAQAKEQAE
jgi:hypothetical protein